MADPEPFSFWKKRWLNSAGNVSQAAAAKKKELEIFQVRCSKMVCKQSTHHKLGWFIFFFLNISIVFK